MSVVSDVDPNPKLHRVEKSRGPLMEAIPQPRSDTETEKAIRYLHQAISLNILPRMTSMTYSIRVVVHRRRLTALPQRRFIVGLGPGPAQLYFASLLISLAVTRQLSVECWSGETKNDAIASPMDRSSSVEDVKVRYKITTALSAFVTITRIRMVMLSRTWHLGSTASLRQYLTLMPPNGFQSSAFFAMFDAQALHIPLQDISWELWSKSS